MFLFRIITVLLASLLTASLPAQPLQPVLPMPGSDNISSGTNLTFPGTKPDSNYLGPLIAPVPLPGIIVGNGGSNRTLSDTASPFLDDTDTGRKRTAGIPLNVPMEETDPLPFIPSRPSTTREEIVRQKQKEAWQRNALLDYDIKKIERQTRIQAGLRELLGEKDTVLPNVLAETAKEDLPLYKSVPDTANNKKPDSNSDVKNEKSPQLPENKKTETESQKQTERIAQLTDPAERKKEEDAMRKNEERLKRWKERYAEMERGADIFELPPKLALPEKLLSGGKCLLFDGKTLFGWREQKDGYYGGGKFSVQDGSICSDPKHPGLLYSVSQFGDMSLSMEYQADADAEVFLLLRTAPNPGDLATQCYAVVLNTKDAVNPCGSILGRNRKAADLLSSINSPARVVSDKEKDKKWSESWHRVNVQFEASQLQVIIDNGEPASLFDAKPLGFGYIGLLVTKGQARFKNLVWSPGSAVPLLDVLSAEKYWRYRQEGEDAVKVRMSVMEHKPQIALQGGPGVIETLEKYGNFVLQLEYNITYSSGRTGIFFRCEPRKEQSGYEVSLQNLPTKEEREKIRGVDAGAFRGRKNGRYVRPEDQKWNHLMLAVVDRHFQTWVNGIPVCEWGDKREEGNDAAKEAVLREGTIQLLLPDKATDVQFRNIRITRIAPRTEKPRTFDDRAKTTWENIKKTEKEKETEKLKDWNMKQGK